MPEYTPKTPRPQHTIAASTRTADPHATPSLEPSPRNAELAVLEVASNRSPQAQAIAQRQRALNQSPRGQSLAQLQRPLNQSSRVTQLAEFSARLQNRSGSFSPAQRRGNEDEERPQGKLDPAQRVSPEEELTADLDASSGAVLQRLPTAAEIWSRTRWATGLYHATVLQPSQIPIVPPATIALMPPANFAQFSVAQLNAFNGQQAAAVTAAQAGSLGAAHATVERHWLADLMVTTATALPPLFLAAMPAGSINVLGSSVLNGFGAGQISALTAGQIHVLAPSTIPQLSIAFLGSLSALALGGLTAAQAARLVAEQVRVLAAQHVPPAALASLGPLETRALSAAQIAALTPPQLAGLTPTQAATILPRLGPAQIPLVMGSAGGVVGPGSLNAALGAAPPPFNLPLESIAPPAVLPAGAGIAALTPAQVAMFDQVHVAGLGAAHAPHLTAPVLRAIPPALLEFLPTPTFAALSVAQRMAMLDGGTTPHLAPAQLNGLPAPALQALREPVIRALTPAQVNSLVPAQFSQLTDQQRSVLTGEQLRSLTQPQFHALTPAQIASFSPTQRAGIPGQYWAGHPNAGALPVAPGAAHRPLLSAVAIGAVPGFPVGDIPSVPIEDISALTGPRVQALSPAQVAALRPAQVQALPPALTAVAAPQLTPAQVPALLPGQVATALPQLPVHTVPLIPASRLGLVPPATIAALAPPRLQAITEVQFAGLNRLQRASLLPPQLNQLTPQQFGWLALVIRPEELPAVPVGHAPSIHRQFDPALIGALPANLANRLPPPPAGGGVLPIADRVDTLRAILPDARRPQLSSVALPGGPAPAGWAALLGQLAGTSPAFAVRTAAAAPANAIAALLTIPALQLANAIRNVLGVFPHMQLHPWFERRPHRNASAGVPGQGLPGPVGLPGAGHANTCPYLEFDLYPSPAQLGLGGGVNRGTHRLVVGIPVVAGLHAGHHPGVGRWFYTPDHYRSFIEI
jgi:hypothetical protein